MLLSNVKEIEIPEGKVKQIEKGSEILWKKSGFTFVNAIIGTGTQFIKLGKTIRQNYRIEMFIECTSLTNTASNEIFGAQSASANFPNGFSLLIYEGKDPYFYKNGYSGRIASKRFWTSGHNFRIRNTTTSSDTLMLFERMQGDSIIEIVTVTAGNSASLSNETLEAYLMKFNTTEKFNYKAGMFKFKGLKVWDENDALVMNILPALDGSGVPCVVDLVDNRILYNAGTGVFGYE